MYRYDEFDHAFVNSRVVQFRDQVRRRLAGDLTEDQFKPLRLQNGLYLQLHAYMLRIAIPYGVLSARQLRQLAFIARICAEITRSFSCRSPRLRTQSLGHNPKKPAQTAQSEERTLTGRPCRRS